MRTHYIGHDKEYHRRKAEGRPGWETVEGVQENVARLESALQSMAVPENAKILEVGCGAGDLALWLAAQGYEAYGMDIAPAAIEWAREKAAERGLSAEFVVGDVLRLEAYVSDCFDLVLDGYCFHCIIGQDRRTFLESVYQVLKPGGTFHLCTMCGEPVTEMARKNYDPVSRCQVSGEIATRYFGQAEEILSEVKVCGFQIARATVEHPQEETGQTLLLADALKPLSES